MLILTPFAGDADVFIDTIKNILDIENIPKQKFMQSNNGERDEDGDGEEEVEESN